MSDVCSWVELDVGHLEAAAPLRLVPQTILKRTLCVLLGDEELYRFRVVKLGERIETHRVGPYSATRGEASVSGSRHRRSADRALEEIYDLAVSRGTGSGRHGERSLHAIRIDVAVPT